MKLSKSLLQAIAAGVVVSIATTSCEKIKEEVDKNSPENVINKTFQKEYETYNCPACGMG